MLNEPMRSFPIAGYPNKSDEYRQHPDDDEHPVLTFETQEGEMPNKKLLHSCPPISWAE
jgi:hypothetical protein